MKLTAKWLKEKGKAMVEEARSKHESGAVDLGGIMVMGLGFVFIAVGFIVFQIFMEAAEDLLDYEYSPCTIITDATYTGFTDIIGITPLLVLVGFLSAGVFAMYLGVQIAKGTAETKLDLGVLILLALAIIFLAVALIILPVALDSVSELIIHEESTSETDDADTSHGGGLHTTANYTLTLTLLCNDIDEVTSVTSNVTGDGTIVVDSYSGGRLYISSLTANLTRTVTTTYNYADEYVQFTGIYDLLLMSPLLLIVSLIGGAIVTGFFGMKRLGGG